MGVTHRGRARRAPRGFRGQCGANRGHTCAETAETSYTIPLRCCGFSPPASRMAGRLVVILDGVPAGLPLDFDRHQRAPAPPPRRLRPWPPHGHRVRRGRGASPASGAAARPARPIALLISNRDWVNWQRTMHVGAEMPDDADRRASARPVVRPRPGHADLAGRPQVRARRHPRRPRARERSRNRGARGRRRAGAAAAGRRRRRRSPATSPRSATWRSRRHASCRSTRRSRLRR